MLLSLPVKKVGARTGYTEGFVVAAGVTLAKSQTHIRAMNLVPCLAIVSHRPRAGGGEGGGGGGASATAASGAGVAGGVREPAESTPTEALPLAAAGAVAAVADASATIPVPLQAFGGKGDSGAAVVGMDNTFRGLLIGSIISVDDDGVRKLTIVLPASRVLHDISEMLPCVTDDGTAAGGGSALQLCPADV